MGGRINEMTRDAAPAPWRGEFEGGGRGLTSGTTRDDGTWGRINEMTRDALDRDRLVL